MAKHPWKMRVMGCLLAKAARFLQAKGPVTRCVLRLWMAARGGENRKGMSKTDIIVQDYFCLLKKVCRQKKPTRIRLSRQDLLQVMADDVPYDFQALIFHNDGKNTERKMEIEALFTSTERTVAREPKILSMVITDLVCVSCFRSSILIA